MNSSPQIRKRRAESSLRAPATRARGLAPNVSVLGPVHLGAFAKGGVAIAGDPTTTESGPIFGGGIAIY